HLLDQRHGAALATRGQVDKRAHATSGVRRHSSQKLTQLMGRTNVEPAIGAMRQACDFPEGLLRNTILALLEHKDGEIEKSKHTGAVTEIVQFLFHGVSDKYHRLHITALCLALGVGDYFTDLGMTTAAVDCGHQGGELLRLREPIGSATFAKSTVIYELNIQSAHSRRFPEHVGL